MLLIHRAGVCVTSEPVSLVWSSLCSPSSLFGNLPELLSEKKVRINCYSYHSSLPMTSECSITKLVQQPNRWSRDVCSLGSFLTSITPNGMWWKRSEWVPIRCLRHRNFCQDRQIRSNEILRHWQGAAEGTGGGGLVSRSLTLQFNPERERLIDEYP